MNVTVFIQPWVGGCQRVSVSTLFPHFSQLLQHGRCRTSNKSCDIWFGWHSSRYWTTIHTRCFFASHHSVAEVIEAIKYVIQPYGGNIDWDLKKRLLGKRGPDWSRIVIEDQSMISSFFFTLCSVFWWLYPATVAGQDLSPPPSFLLPRLTARNRAFRIPHTRAVSTRMGVTFGWTLSNCMSFTTETTHFSVIWVSISIYLNVTELN